MKVLSKFFDGTFFYAGNVGSGDSEFLCDLALGIFFSLKKSIPHPQYILFPLSQKLFHVLIEKSGVFFQDHFVVDIVVGRFQDIIQADFISFLVGADALVERNIFGCFLLCTQHHQDFVVDTLAGVSSQTIVAGGIKGCDGFDQTDGSDRDQIFRIFIP